MRYSRNAMGAGYSTDSSYEQSDDEGQPAATVDEQEATSANKPTAMETEEQKEEQAVQRPTSDALEGNKDGLQKEIHHLSNNLQDLGATMEKNLKEFREDLSHQREVLGDLRRNRTKEMEEILMASKRRAQLWEDEAQSLRKDWKREREERLRLQKLLRTIRNDLK